MSASARSISAKTRMAELLDVENLSAGYGEARVVHGVSFAMEDGQSLALLGRNGVGKTTLLRTLTPSIVQSLAEALRTVTRAKGLALLLVDQNPELAMRICDRVMVMERGQVVAAGSSATLANDPSFLDLLVV